MQIYTSVIVTYPNGASTYIDSQLRSRFSNHDRQIFYRRNMLFKLTKVADIELIFLRRSMYLASSSHHPISIINQGRDSGSIISLKKFHLSMLNVQRSTFESTTGCDGSSSYYTVSIYPVFLLFPRQAPNSTLSFESYASEFIDQLSTSRPDTVRSNLEVYGVACVPAQGTKARTVVRIVGTRSVRRE